MIGKNFIYNGVSIPYSADDARTARWVADIDIHRTSTDNGSIDRQDFHGSIAYPTYARGRVIPVSGQIYGSKTERGTARNTIESTFPFQGFPVRTNEFKKLEFTDDDNTEWFINAKVYTLPQYDHERAGYVAGFSLNLYAEDPLIRSKNVVTVSGNYGMIGGMTLPITLPSDLGDTIGTVSAVNAGSFASPCRVTITGDIKNPKILNLTTGTYWKTEVDMTTETLILDTGLDGSTKLCTLDGVNVLSQRMSGSNWLYANSGTNYFVLIGDDYEFGSASKVSFTVEFYSAKI